MSTNEVRSYGGPAPEVEALCRLLQTELSACAVYRTAVYAIERGEDYPALSLRCLYRSHRRLSDELRALVLRLGGSPWETLDASGAWAAVHERVAELAGRADGPTMVRALRLGERHTLEAARDTVRRLDGPSAEWVEERFVKAVEGNLGLLEALDRSARDEKRSAREA